MYYNTFNVRDFNLDKKNPPSSVLAFEIHEFKRPTLTAF